LVIGSCNSLNGGIYHDAAVGGAAWPYSVGIIRRAQATPFFSMHRCIRFQYRELDDMDMLRLHPSQ
jgi:hypothetical protein